MLRKKSKVFDIQRTIKIKIIMRKKCNIKLKRIHLKVVDGQVNGQIKNYSNQQDKQKQILTNLLQLCFLIQRKKSNNRQETSLKNLFFKTDNSRSEKHDI